MEARAVERARRRRRLLGWSALPGLAVAALGGVLIGRAVANERGIDAVEHSTFARARALDAIDWFDRAGWIELTDRELAPFNRGVAWFRAGELGQARGEFEAALRAAGEGTRCRTIVNLALTVEAQGDTTIDLNPVDAQALYAEAKGIAQSNPECLARTTPDGDGEGDRLTRLLARLAEKMPREAGQEVTRSRSDTGGTRDPDDNFSELEQQLDENAETRSEGRELEEEVVLDPSVFDGPQW
jgi:hypothetical protein